MKIETTASGYKYDLPADAPTKRFREDAHTKPLNERHCGEYFYVLLNGRSEFIHAMLLDAATMPAKEDA